MSFARAIVAVAIALCAVGGPGLARAEGKPRPAVFALIIGSNESADRDLPPLKYADDDAARYLDLFRMLGARTYLLARPDENTARLHPQAAAEAVSPRRAELDRAVQQAATDVAQAKARGIETLLYVLYAGHGSVRNGQGYITLEDARLTGEDLATAIVARVPADRFHVVIDACDAYLVAYPRGPGGVRSAAPPFKEMRRLGDDPRVGLLLSSSSSRESHEWEGFQAGVFSHEVRSGLYGAADADGDGVVTYREIAAFVRRANMAIPNERFRPEVHARAPAGAPGLLDLRGHDGRRVTIDGKHAGHWILEDARGVRVADAHNAPGAAVRLLRPPPSGAEYLRRLDDDVEFALPTDRDAVAIADVGASEPRVRARGAAHEAFTLVFSLPFDATVVDTYEEPIERAPDLRAPDAPTAAPPRSSVRRALGWGGLGLGAAGIGGGAILSILAANAAAGSSPAESEESAAKRNTRIKTENVAAAVGYGAGAALAVTGLVLLLWPDAPRAVVNVTSSSTLLGFGTNF